MILALLLFSRLAFADATLRVRSRVVVAPRTQVTLADLMDMQGVSDESRRKMEAINITMAPAYGEKRELSNNTMRSVMRSVVEGERARTGQKVHLILPESVIIDTMNRKMNGDQIAAELLKVWQPLCPECKLEIEGLSLPRIADMKDWTMRIKNELPHGPFSVPMEVIRANGSPAPAWVSGRLVTKRKVPVAKRLLGINERVQPQDIEWEFRDTTYSTDGIPTTEELTGKRLRMALRAGDVLWRSQLDKDKAIRRGELVQVRSAEAGWEVWLSVVAQQDAVVGDVINFKNPKTNGTFLAEVVGPGRVELR